MRASGWLPPRHPASGIGRKPSRMAAATPLSVCGGCFDFLRQPDGCPHGIPPRASAGNRHGCLRQPSLGVCGGCFDFLRHPDGCPRSIPPRASAGNCHGCLRQPLWGVCGGCFGFLRQLISGVCGKMFLGGMESRNKKMFHGIPGGRVKSISGAIFDHFWGLFCATLLSRGKPL